MIFSYFYQITWRVSCEPKIGEFSVILSGVVLSKGDANSGGELTGVEYSKVVSFINEFAGVEYSQVESFINDLSCKQN